MLLTKKDCLCSIMVGEISSWFLILIIKNPLIIELGRATILSKIIWFLPVVFPFIFLLGSLVGKFLSRIIPVIFQIVRYGEIGVLNTFIDFGVLNLLSWNAGITSGKYIALFNTISFLCAATNSYYWNRFWTFPSRKSATSREFFRFLVITGVGWGINTGIVFGGTTYIAPFAGLSGGTWMNVIKLSAIIFSLIWNFSGYKFLVFKK